MTDPKQAKEATDEPEADEKAAEPKPKGIDYVFKIAPADPKNNFDFEDVADK